MNKLLTAEQKDIVRDEWDKMQEFINTPPRPLPLNACKVLFADPQYNYTTSVSSQSTEASCRAYFVNQFLNFGDDCHENMQRCIDIEFIDKQNTPKP